MVCVIELERKMGKYQPLNAFLTGRADAAIPMTFGQIEQVLGFRLPPSKKQRAWWSNNPTNNVMTKEWLDAGYETESVDVIGEKLVFRRLAEAESEMETTGFGEAPQAQLTAATAQPRHPLFGCLKGMLTIPPDLDLTQPADPDLADYLDKKYGEEWTLDR